MEERRAPVEAPTAAEIKPSSMDDCRKQPGSDGANVVSCVEEDEEEKGGKVGTAILLATKDSEDGEVDMAEGESSA